MGCWPVWTTWWVYLCIPSIPLHNIDFGWLGHGDTEDNFKPNLVRALDNVEVVQVECGWYHTVARGMQYYIMVLWLGLCNCVWIRWLECVLVLVHVLTHSWCCFYLGVLGSIYTWGKHCIIFACTIHWLCWFQGNGANGQLGLKDSEDKTEPTKYLIYTSLITCIDHNLTCGYQDSWNWRRKHVFWEGDMWCHCHLCHLEPLHTCPSQVCATVGVSLVLVWCGVVCCGAVCCGVLCYGGVVVIIVFSFRCIGCNGSAKDVEMVQAFLSGVCGNDSRLYQEVAHRIVTIRGEYSVMWTCWWWWCSWWW